MTTSIRPLMVGFMTPYVPKTVKAEESKIIYDPTTQLTFFMGGKSGPTRSNDGYKHTVEQGPHGTYTSNDAERYTDD